MIYAETWTLDHEHSMSVETTGTLRLDLEAEQGLWFRARVCSWVQGSQFGILGRCVWVCALVETLEYVNLTRKPSFHLAW